MFELKELRADKRLTQKQMAEILKCGQPNIVAIEKEGKELTDYQFEILVDKYGEDYVNSFYVKSPEENNRITSSANQKNFDLKSFRVLNKLTQSQLADYLGVTQAFVSQIENTGKPIPDEYISKIKTDNIYNISKAYVLAKANSDIVIAHNANYRLLPFINMDVAGGVGNQEVDTHQYTKEYMPFVNAKEGDICCPVTGRSMEPVYPGGCIVQLRKIYKWKEYLEYGQVYVLDLEDGRRLIKEVKKGKNENFFMLSSCNKEYEDREIPVNMIYSVWLVIAKYEKATM